MRKIKVTLKKYVKAVKLDFKNRFQEQKKKPRSKRKSFMLGVATSMVVFGLFGRTLSALAADVPASPPPPTTVPTPAPEKVGVVSGILRLMNSGTNNSPGAYLLGLGIGCIFITVVLRFEGKR